MVTLFITVVYQIIIFILWFTSGNRHKLVARQHKSFFSVMYMLCRPFPPPMVAMDYFLVLILYSLKKKNLNKSDGERVNDFN